ncbi:hypothetical protein PIB30_017986 [Stylosanthes scabra]|uniref:Uncharacterized protein n=1 Tax=Stylosanthes scabra TaxID=79078 RepID=A0ABU6U6L8_9FABA|nr:hypothetical protein [Stylosanthes scabra]
MTPIGIIALLHEACIFPESTYKTFSTKLFNCFRSHRKLTKEKLSPTDFTITHYGGEVTYHTDSFLDKNRDYVVVEHRNLLSSSKCPLVSGLSLLLPERSSRSSYKFSSVALRFKQQLQALMETLKPTDPHYIRCVKPNSLNWSQKFENSSVVHQLRCGGVLEAVRISLAGYPIRRTYSDFVDRFGLIAPEYMDGSYDNKVATEGILKKIKLDNFELGRTKVFLKAGQIGILDSRRAELLHNAAKYIQRRQTFILRRNFIKLRAAAVSIQSCCRGSIARKVYVAKRETAAAISIQKYIRMCVSRCAYLKLYSATVVIQSHVRGFTTRKRFLHGKEHRAATVIQAYWRMSKVRSAFKQHQASTVAIQCLWRRKQAKRELRRLKQEANELGALRLAKSELEKQLDVLKWRLHLEKKIRVSNEESKQMEISKLQEMLQALNLELDAAKLATINECNKNAVLQNQLEKELVVVDVVRKENALLKDSLSAFEKKYTNLELELMNAQKGCNEMDEKRRDFEQKCSLLEHSVRSLEGKILNLEEENHVLRQKALSAAPKINSSWLAKSLSGESPTPTKLISPFMSSSTDSRHTKLTTERHQDNYEFLSRCIKENLGFKNGKPLAACIIYKCLLQSHAIESEHTAIFDYIIEGINDVLEVKDKDNGSVLPYWLSNASALICLLERNMRSNASSGFRSRLGLGPKFPMKLIGYDDGVSHVVARYPAILFKQQLTACVEKSFGIIRHNLKKELYPLLELCIQEARVGISRGRKSTRSPVTPPQQSSGGKWDNIVKFVDALMSQLRENHVPSFFIRKLVSQVFSFINIELFNSLLLRRECCTLSNGEYLKFGLAELENWIGNATEEYAGTSWHELNYIRQAVGFLVIHQKRKKSLEEICQDLCPALTVRQIYRICTMYWDDKYSTQSVSNEAISEMREILSKDIQNVTSNSFLLDDNLSIPFSAEDIYMEIPPIDPDEIELPPFLSEHPYALFLTSLQKSTTVS